MLFNSFSFLLFLGVVVVLFFIIPHKYRWTWLLIASLYFYISWSWKLLPPLLLVISTLVAYFCGLGIKHADEDQGRKKLFLGIGCLINLGLLAVFKFADFAVEQLNSALNTSIPQPDLFLPVGLSFYIFMTVTYIVDVYRKDMEAEPHLGRFGLYVSYFPKIFAGPIERARTFLPQLREKIHFDQEKASMGFYLILLGLFKKVVIADRIAPFVDNVFSKPAYAPPIDIIIGIYFFAFQIYCDFSGYTDIARGAAKLMGFELMENFRRPYLSKSPSEFWAKRWHISLASWFRDYLYIPLGGSRAGVPRHYANLMIVFVISGLWHAGLGYGVNWTFMIWGALNGFYQWVSVGSSPLWKKIGNTVPFLKDNPVINIIRSLFTFHLILFSWIFFRVNSIEDGFNMLSNISKRAKLIPRLLKFYNFTPELLISFALIGILIIFEIIDERKSVWERLKTKPLAVRWAFHYVLIFSLIILGKWGVQQFIYMQF
ncbi:MAG: MBOAT family protein [Spirochaetes bacterium]|nr:MAG: MBOAT family protein [Spirochaetota bacterium]